MTGLSRGNVLMIVMAASTIVSSLTACSPGFEVVSKPARPTDPVVLSSNVRTPEAGGVGVTFQAVSANDSIDAVEFYHAAFNHYFYTVDVAEMGLLDTGYFSEPGRMRGN